jgi:CheY-like chemotaxis protein
MNRLLLVDGDPRSLNVLGVSLAQAGYEVASAGDGLDGLAKVEAVDPQLVIVSGRLRKVDGFEFVRQLRERAPAMPVMLIGTEESVEERRRVLELGVDDYLSKPVFVRELVARVNLLFARRTRESLAELLRVGNSRLAGSTRDVAVVDLVQAMDAAGESGVLHLSSGPHKARMYFREGHVVDADLGTMRGEDAIYRAFLWYDALFELELRPVTNADVVVCSTQTIVRKGMQRIDAWLGSPEPVDGHADARENPDIVTPTMSHVAAPVEAPPAVAPVELPSTALPPAVEHVSVATSVGQVAEAARAPATTTRSSSAPWTREVEPGADEVDEGWDDDGAVAAGLPPRTRKVKGLVVVTVAVAAMAALTAGMRSPRTWQPWRAIADYGARDTAAVAAATAAVVPSISSERAQPGGPLVADPAPAPPPALFNPTSTAISTPIEEQEGRGTPTAKSDTAGGRENAAAIAKEAPIDIVKLAAGSLSPLVKDAQRALLKGQTEQALALANKAVTERPTDADAWLTLAAAQKASGDSAAARETYLNCVERAQTANLNHCRILSGKPRSDAHGLPSPEAPAAAPSEATATISTEVAQASSTTPPPAPRLGIHAPESAPASKASDQAPRTPPAPSSTEGTPPASTTN